LLDVPVPQFWFDLMKMYAEKGAVISNNRWAFAAHMATFCDFHADVLSPAIFKQLTDEKYLPENRIGPVNVMILLDAERRIIGNSDEQPVGGDDELSNLQLRCVNAIAADDEEELRGLDHEWCCGVFKKLPHCVLYEIITRGFIPPPIT
jgi:hypothetical protein